jgi:hypothetical protein
MEMVQPSVTAVFTLPEEKAIRFDKKLSSHIVPLVFSQGFSA